MRANVCAAVAVLLGITAIWLDIPAARAANPDAHLALDMMARERS